MKVKVVASPEGKFSVPIGEILDKTEFDPEQGTAGVQKALIVIQALKPGVQYISLVLVAIQTPAHVVEYIQLTLQSASLKARDALELRSCHVIYHWYPIQRRLPAEEVDALDSHAQGVDTSRAQSLEIDVCERSVLSEASREG